jgi:glutamine amidotransferase
MCELFGLNSSEPAAVTFSFTGLSARGGRTGEHADGFGLAFHDGIDCRLFIDEGRASDSALAQFLRSHPIRARHVLAHIRKATQGSVQLANCHPFVREWGGRYWSFCHNGNLVDFAPSLNGVHAPVGSTDSERAFCWMLQELRQRFGSPPAGGWCELAPAIAELAGRIGAHGPFNFLLCDGHALYAHCGSRLAWVQRSYPFATAHLVDEELALDLGTANAPEDRMALVATEPLTRNEAWSSFAQGETRVFARGVEVWHSGAQAGAQNRTRPVPVAARRRAPVVPGAIAPA